jgi:hypothetical protein
MLRLRKAFATLTTPLFPFYSGCSRCGIRWYFLVKNRWWQKMLGGDHMTPYGNGQGCFPLCEFCWQDLGTPSARLPFYEQLIKAWYDECLNSAFQPKVLVFSAGDWHVETAHRHEEWFASIDEAAPLIRAAVAEGK